ncbi:MAG TPA: hypothetical protein VGD78_11930 [Chthoniobacterales bacterium]
MIEQREVSQQVQDGPYGWPASYRVRVDPQQITLNVRVQFQPAAGTSLEEVAAVKRETSEAVSRYYDQKFGVKEPGGHERGVQVRVEFVDSDPDLKVTLHAGAGRDNLRHWFVKSGVVARAHEIGHALGLKDEYVDPLVEGRSSKGSPAVFRDHSLFGNFHEEGVERAELKLRHAARLTETWGEAFGKRFEVGPEMGVGGTRQGVAGAGKLTFERLRELVTGRGSNSLPDQRVNTGLKT